MQMRTDYISKVHYEKNIAYNDESFKPMTQSRIANENGLYFSNECPQTTKVSNKNEHVKCKRERIIFLERAPSNDENFKQKRTRKMQMRKDYISKVHREKNIA